ncbi:hypothetical protein LguiB_004483 [Lonicera macranthoides]
MSTRGKTTGSSSGQFPRRWIYPCNHCPRYFFSPQALGGHQRAHRALRAPVFLQVLQPPLVVLDPFAEGVGDNFSRVVINNPGRLVVDQAHEASSTIGEESDPELDLELRL